MGNYKRSNNNGKRSAPSVSIKNRRLSKLKCWNKKRREQLNETLDSSTRFSEFKLFVHDVEYTVKPGEVPPETSLNKYLRQNAHLPGTKFMCLEGGCGACIVAATAMDPVTNREVVFAVNSCLVPIYSCSGWKIHTVDALGDAKMGYHPVQKALVQFNGTQCGYCSSGMVMNMYALYESGKFTMKDVENSFGGNICRCTGYRPILSAFKSLASDASAEVIGTFADIEDIPVCKTTQGKCQSNCKTLCSKNGQSHYYDFGESKWIKAFSINEILDAIRDAKDATYMLVGGNTAKGVYKRTKNPDIYIDITSVKNLLEYTVNGENLILGANMSLTNVMNLFYMLAKEKPQFSYLEKLGDHIDLIANVPVRNTGTLAGNLFIKHEYHEFPSDIFLMLETAGATLTIVGTDHQESIKSLVDFLSFDMKNKIIKNVTLPALDNHYKYESYKIMPRAQNAHALVNGGFLIKLDDNHKVESARIVYGSINPDFIHAKAAESYLIGKDLFDNSTLQGTFQALDSELKPDHVLPDPEPEFRKKLAISLFYKFVLSISPSDKLSPRNKSGGSKQTRPVSSGTQDYGTNESMYPVTKPISKIEALAQCNGQAEYVMDIPDRPGQLFATFVLAKAPANSVIAQTDPAEALKLDGVVAYYDKNDIPGDNNFTPKIALPQFFTRDEEIFCSGIVQYYFQPVGIVVAKSQELAEKAADMVQITYKEGQRKPLVTIRDIIKADAKDKIKVVGKRDAKSKGADVKRVVKGKFDIYWQYHYHMETQCCAVIPVEDGGLDMYPTTQGISIAQVAASKALNIPVNKINVMVRRVGGAYGGKIARSSLISTAAALAAHKLRKPVKLWMPLTANMNAIGKRAPLSTDYEAGVDDKGVIQYLNFFLYSDVGINGGNEVSPAMVFNDVGHFYNRDTWNINMYSTEADTPAGAACRAPGTTEAVAAAENIMQHIGVALDIDPVKVRLNNISKDDHDHAKYINELMKWAEVEKRKKEIEEFNKANRWVKKGIAVVPMKYPFSLFGYWNVLVSIYQADGTVKVAHGGIEMGQGINTKVVQVCAYALGIPLDQISVKPTTDLVSPNSMCTGGSVTSELVCYATLKACNILKERMQHVKEAMNNPTWLDLVRKCYVESVDLSASFLFQPKVKDLHAYPIYGATCVETEVDILTGLYQFTRVDLLEDTGDSLSPQIDIGQVEGAFVMGLGYWTSEQLVHTEEGELLTNRTWNYKPPGVKDIPIDFRVKFPKNNPNDVGFLHSKATAEPPLNLACAAPFAIRDAVASARKEADSTAEAWYPIDGPSTVENTFVNSLHDYKQYVL